jgi:hypothetical protein
VQTARMDAGWFSESVARFVGRPMPRLPGIGNSSTAHNEKFG